MSQHRITEQDVEYVAKLSRLGLSADEKKMFVPQLDQILGYVDKLNELDTTQVEPMTHAMDRQNVYRNDEPAASIDRETVLDLAPQKDAQYYLVPKIIE